MPPRVRKASPCRLRRSSTGWFPLPDQPHELSLERGEDAAKLLTPLENQAMFADQGKRPLLQSKLWAFLYPHLGTLRVTPIRREDRDVGIDPKRVIAPMPSRDHPTVQI
jgi:hypothetical protein